MNQNLTLSILQEGDVEIKGQFTFGSNYTFLADISYQGGTIPAVYKPSRGEAPLWDFPVRSLAKREVAAFLLSESLGWDLVPLTIYRKKNLPLGSGSLQLYIEHDPNYHYFSFIGLDKQKLRPVAVFDLIANNADRKGGHVLFDQGGHLWAIDHGLCFHEQDKLRTVIWDFIGEEIPDDLLNDLQQLVDSFERPHSFVMNMSPYLSGAEIGAIKLRIQNLIIHGVFPQPPEDRRPYPYPPV